jgi:hypothetical protein
MKWFVVKSKVAFSLTDRLYTPGAVFYMTQHKLQNRLNGEYIIYLFIDSNNTHEIEWDYTPQIQKWFTTDVGSQFNLTTNRLGKKLALINSDSAKNSITSEFDMLAQQRINIILRWSGTYKS